MHAVSPRNHRHRLAGHPNYAAVNERRPRGDAGVVDQKFRDGTVSRVDYKVMRTDNTRRVGLVERNSMPLDFDLGEIARPSHRAAAFTFDTPISLLR